MKNIVFNNKIGSPYVPKYPKLTKVQEQNLIASLFEQLLIFDQVIITTNTVNFALAFLLKKLGINIVEKLFERNYIKLMLWTPVMITSGYRQQEGKPINNSEIFTSTPLLTGELTDEDLDPEKNVSKAFKPFNCNRDRRRIFTKKVIKNYIVPDGMAFSSDASKIVIDAYENNNFSALGFPFKEESNKLNIEDRGKLLDLGHKALEIAILSKYGFKSYENYEHYQIYEQNLYNIGKGYNVSEGTSAILNLEKLPDLKSFFINENLKFDDLFRIRHLKNAKFYRKWINEIAESSNAEEITQEYFNEVKGSNKFFNSQGGKLVRNLSVFAIGTALKTAIAHPAGILVAGGLGLLNALVLDGILIGKNPSMFVNDLKKNI